MIVWRFFVWLVRIRSRLLIKEESCYKEMKQRAVDLMTKQQIIDVVRKSECKKLVGLALHTMTREQLISHLERSCCEVIKSLCEKM